jgi:hypothetical protein
LGDDHAGNVHERTRQGYEPVRPEELGGDWQADVLDTGKHAGIVRSGDLILMKVDQEIADQRNEYFANKTKAAEGAVNSELQKNNSALRTNRLVTSALHNNNNGGKTWHMV